MSLRKVEVSRAALLNAAEVSADPLVFDPVSPVIGDAASKEALRKLNQAVAELGHQEMPRLLRQAIRGINERQYAAAEKLALTALNLDEHQGIAWHVLAIAREKTGDFGGSLRCYDAALRLLPDDITIALDLGRLASRMGMPDFALRLYRLYLERNPDHLEATNNMATSMRDLALFDEAIEVLKPILTRKPESHLLWNTLGTVVKAKGDTTTSQVFFDEAIRLNPKFAVAYHNRGGARYDEGQLLSSLEDCESALSLTQDSSDRDNMRFSLATTLLALGQLEAGWRDYEARLTRGHGDSARFVANAPDWSPEADLAGKHVVVFCEQGVGDEILFAGHIPDLIDAVGADGRVTVITERRLQALFQRSFPLAKILTHRTVRLEGRITRGSLDIEDWSDVDCWAPAGSFLQRFRTDLEAFPTGPYLVPAPDRVGHWRAWLETLPPGPKVGILWKSQKLTGERNRFYSPFEGWQSILTTPGAVFINVQYGDCEQELIQARTEFGVEIVQPPEIDLKMDLDELAALVAALDVVVGSPNATTQIAGAVGTPVWMITAKVVWTQLGADHYPWFPQVRCFNTQSTLDWSATMDTVAGELLRASKGEIPFHRVA